MFIPTFFYFILKEPSHLEDSAKIKDAIPTGIGHHIQKSKQAQKINAIINIKTNGKTDIGSLSLNIVLFPFYFILSQ